MRTSAVITVSLPPKLAATSQKLAKKNNMTRSELMRAALRAYLEVNMAEEAIRAFRKEAREGTLKEATGSLSDIV